MALVLDGDNGIVGVLATNADGDVIIDTNTFFVDAPNNRVGIGTINPDRPLHILSSSNNAPLKIDTSDGTQACIAYALNGNDIWYAGVDLNANGGEDFFIYDATAGAGNRLLIDTNGNVGIGTTSPTKKLDIRGGDVTIYGGVDGYNADQERVRLYMGNNNAHIGAMYNYGLFFDSGNSAGDAMMIRQSSGNVIIGDINTEGYKLEVVSDNAANNLMVHKKNATGPGLATNIAMQVTQTNGQSARLAEIGADFASGWGGSLHFATKNDNGSPNNSTTERMRIDYDGRVTMPYQPSFCAGVGTSYTLVNFSQKINHSHEFSNIGGHYNNTNNRFTAPVAGNYFFWHRMNFGNAGTGNVEAKIFINGVEKFRDYEYAGGSAQYNNSLSLGTYYMNAGDYAEPWSHVNNSPQPTLVGSTTIQISTFGGWLNT